MTEVWRAIPGFEDAYEASSFGRIRSLGMCANGSNGSRRFIKGRVLKQSPSGRYKTVGLRGHTFNVHTLIALTFLGASRGRDVCHGALGTTVNHLSNLSYSSRSNNHYDKYRDDTMPCRTVKRSDGVVFRSLQEAGRETKVQAGSICLVCQGKRRTAGGYGWEYAD